jgi:hypothetical protein
MSNAIDAIKVFTIHIAAQARAQVPARDHARRR